MTVLTHIVYALAYLVAGVSIGAGLPFLLPGTDPVTGGLAGIALVLAGGLLHETMTRLTRGRATNRRVARLEEAVAALLEEVGRHKALLAQAEQATGGPGGYETIVQEVKLLQSLVARLTERRAPRPPTAMRKPMESGGAALSPQAPKVAASPEPHSEEHSDAPFEAPAVELDDAAVLEAVRDALKAGRIDIHLQPIVSLPQRKHRFYEVFSRVRSADGSLIMPDRYLDIAEREGLIATIDNLLLVRCVQLIRETERRQHAIGFFSNISAATLSDADFMRQFLQLMARNQALVPKLVFELSQQELRAGGAVTMGILGQLARIGFRFSLDQVADPDLDVETLLSHDFRYVKLDRALLADPEAARHVADLRRRIAGAPIDIIVEKIETEHQLLEVLDIGFDFGQGYLFGEPRLSKKPASL